MAGSRTLKLSILADIDNLQKNLKQADTEVQGFGGKLEKFGKVAAAAFAAAAAAAVAYAGKLAVDGVKAAIEDEAAQTRLANALKNVTGATNAQIASVEKQINQMSMATGVADDKLRPAFARLARATGDITEANDSLKLALDISASTGKDVEAVANALGKAYEGNTSALGRLGLGLSSAEMKSLGLEGTIAKLTELMGGAAAAQANTLEGQINRLKNQFDETKESVGAALLPAVKAFIDYIVNRFIPLIIEAKDKALAPIQKAFEDNKEAIMDLWQFTKDYLVPLFEFTLVRAIEGVGKAVASIITIIGKVVDAIKSLVREAVDAINSLISLVNRIPGVNIPGITLPSFATSSGGVGLQRVTAGATSTGGALAGIVGSLGSAISGVSSSVSGGSGGGRAGGSAASALAQIESDFAKLQQLLGILTGEGAPSVSATYGAFQPMSQSGLSGGAAGGIVTINVNAPSVIDETGFTRAVVDALNSVERRQGGGASALVGL